MRETGHVTKIYSRLLTPYVSICPEPLNESSRKLSLIANKHLLLALFWPQTQALSFSARCHTVILINDFITCLAVEGRHFSAAQYISSLPLQNGFTQGRQYIILSGFTLEKKHLLYFSKPNLSHSDASLLYIVHCHLDY